MTGFAVTGTTARTARATTPGLIVHEWVERWGGAERVLDAMMDAFPEAGVRVLWDDTPVLDGREVTESWIARTPLRNNKALALPAMLPTWRVPSPGSPEWMLVSSHLFAHHVKARPGTRKYVYAHTPARYIWEPERDHRGDSAWARAASTILKPIDRRRAAEATSIAVNSRFTGERVTRAWEQPSQVIYPPVDTKRLVATDDWSPFLTDDEQRQLDALPAHFLLGASRMVDYKRLDRVIQIGAQVKVPVVIAGTGPSHVALRSWAAASGAEVTFIIAPSDAMLYALYRRALVYVFPAVEDFGIMPVEAMACGTPILASSVGGVPETVEAVGGGVTCEIERWNDWDELIHQATSLDAAAFRERTQMFSRARFIAELHDWVGSE
ncbi:glycosyltransferase [uncultured Microbacterium sp.]|uniref:glycosyltransferase n=1 Tax=uncultured Microbacterium sp. TaxID=191216 RepID=UPI0028D81B35|nr:glycosyltransferase [uncultured Microbacterium sp.]